MPSALSFPALKGEGCRAIGSTASEEGLNLILEASDNLATIELDEIDGDVAFAMSPDIHNLSMGSPPDDQRFFFKSRERAVIEKIFF